MSERERLYDEEIAPALLEIGKKCEAAGLSFVAVVEWEQGEIGRTSTVREYAGIETRLVDWAARANGNIDALAIAASRHAHKYGHGSMVLKLMGVPTTPKPSLRPDAYASAHAVTEAPITTVAGATP